MRSDIFMPGFPSAFSDEATARAAGDWAKWALFGDERAKSMYQSATGKIGKAQNEGSNAAGGFLVAPELARAVFTLLPLYGTIAANSQLRRMASDKLNVPVGDNAVTAYFINEGIVATETEESFASIALSARKLLALLRISSELAEDAVGLAEHLARVLASAIANVQDRVGWIGTGAASDGGIIGLVTRLQDGGHTASLVTAGANHDTLAEIDGTDLGSLVALCPDFALGTAKWFVPVQAVGNVFVRLGASACGTVMGPAGPRPMMQYMGWEIVPTRKLTGAGDLTGLPMIVFGDLSQAASFGLRRDVTIQLSKARYFENDQVGVKASTRFDFVPHSLGDVTNPGSLVALVGA